VLGWYLPQSGHRSSVRKRYSERGARELSEQIRTYDFDQVAFIILLILAAVGMIDWVSGRLRHAMIGRRPKTG
jgi:hypothetical protein